MSPERKNLIILIVSIVASFTCGYVLHEFTRGAIVVESVNAPKEPIQPGLIVVDGREIPVWPGARVDIEIEETDSVGAGTEWQVQQGESVGSKMRKLGSGDTDFKAETPELDLSSAGITGVAGAVAYKAKSLLARGPLVIIGLGALLLIGGIIVAVKFDKGIGIRVALCGVLLMIMGVAFERYPWAALAIIVVVLGVAGYFIYRAYRSKQADLTLTTVAQAIDTAPAAAKAAVKGQIKAITFGDRIKDKAVRNTVERVKSKPEFKATAPAPTAPPAAP